MTMLFTVIHIISHIFFRWLKQDAYYWEKGERRETRGTKLEELELWQVISNWASFPDITYDQLRK